MPKHDPLCKYANPERFHPITFGGAPFPCDCDLIAKVRDGIEPTAEQIEESVAAIVARTRERIATDIEAAHGDDCPAQVTHTVVGDAWVERVDEYLCSCAASAAIAHGS